MTQFYIFLPKVVSLADWHPFEEVQGSSPHPGRFALPLYCLKKGMFYSAYLVYLLLFLFCVLPYTIHVLLCRGFTCCTFSGTHMNTNISETCCIVKENPTYSEAQLCRKNLMPSFILLFFLEKNN